jgi:hypothetical protein
MFLSDSQRRCLEQLAEEKGHTSCFNCGSQRVSVQEYESRWLLGGSVQVVLECHDCGADSANFIISPEEARGCGIYPEDPPISETI